MKMKETLAMQNFGQTRTPNWNAVWSLTIGVCGLIIAEFLPAAFGPVPPSWAAWVARKVPQHAETASGLYVAAVQSSAAIGAFGGGVAFDFRGSTAVFLLCCVSWVISALLVFRKVSPTRSGARRPTAESRVQEVLCYE